MLSTFSKQPNVYIFLGGNHSPRLVQALNQLPLDDLQKVTLVSTTPQKALGIEGFPIETAREFKNLFWQQAGKQRFSRDHDVDGLAKMFKSVNVADQVRLTAFAFETLD
jgi:hypothetical protein